MIRPFSFVCLLLAAGAGLYLYQAKQQGRLLDRQIRQVREQTEATRQRAEVLRAEYTLLNDPNRLAELVAENLPGLKPTQPAQWSSLADLDRRLPPVGGAAAEPGPVEPAPEPAGPPLVATAEPPSVAAAEPPRVATAEPPRTATAEPPRVAAAEPPHQVAPRPVQVVAARPPPPRPIIALAREQPPPAPRPVMRVQWPTPPTRAPRSPPPVAPAEAIAAIARGAPVDPSVPVVASALGMARSMTVPVAITPAYAASPAGGGAR